MFNIRIEFYNQRREIVKTNRAIYANKSVEAAVKFLAVGAYNAVSAQVFDIDTGEVHGEVVLKKNGQIVVTYLRDAAQYETRIRFDVLMREK